MCICGCRTQICIGNRDPDEISGYDREEFTAAFPKICRSTARIYDSFSCLFSHKCSEHARVIPLVLSGSSWIFQCESYLPMDCDGRRIRRMPETDFTLRGKSGKNRIFWDGCMYTWNGLFPDPVAKGRKRNLLFLTPVFLRKTAFIEIVDIVGPKFRIFSWSFQSSRDPGSVPAVVQRLPEECKEFNRQYQKVTKAKSVFTSDLLIEKML